MMKDAQNFSDTPKVLELVIGSICVQTHVPSAAPPGAQNSYPLPFFSTVKDSCDYSGPS